MAIASFLLMVSAERCRLRRCNSVSMQENEIGPTEYETRWNLGRFRQLRNLRTKLKVVYGCILGWSTRAKMERGRQRVGWKAVRGRKGRSRKRKRKDA